MDQLNEWVNTHKYVVAVTVVAVVSIIMLNRRPTFQDQMYLIASPG